MQKAHYTYLALGDSYTIGESLPEKDNFPHQTVDILSNAGYAFEPPVIIAKTGWTTDELQNGIVGGKPKAEYDFVSLLIGVNNQYRGKSIEEYSVQFEELLQKSIKFAGQKPRHVFVLSIPDWGVTPFAAGTNRQRVAKEIDTFNIINRSLSAKWNVNYIDVTPGTREAAGDRSLIAEDGLHPSAKDYKRWAEKLAFCIQQQL